MSRKLSALAAATALLVAAIPGTAQAQTAQDENLSYPRLTHCAALNILLGQFLGMGDDKDQPEVKAQVATYIAQAAALTMVAAAMNQMDPKQVQEDVFAKNEALTQSFSHKEAAEELLQRDLGPCNDLGKAAHEAVQNAGNG